MNVLRGASVFVTGGTGLVGSWLVRRLLSEGADVSVLVRDEDPQSLLMTSGDIRKCRVVSGRLEEVEDLERALVSQEVEWVFHLGAQTLVTHALRSPLATFEANVRGSYNLLEACRRQPHRLRAVVVASSDKAYGDSANLPYTEETPLDARHPYDVSKSCTDLIARCHGVPYGLPVVIARCGNVFGGGDLNWSRIVPGTIRSVLAGQRPVIRSDGSLLRDYLFVDDVVDAYLALALRAQEDSVRGEAFNFGPHKPLTVLELTGILLELLGRPDLRPDVQNTARAEIQAQFLDSRKAREVLGWDLKRTLHAGLLETIDWCRGHLGAR